MITAFEIWVVGGAVAAGFVSARALPLAPVAAAVFWLLRGLAYRRLSVRTVADWAVTVLALMIPITLWATAFPDLTCPQVFRLLSGIALYYALVNWAVTPGRLRWVARGAVATGFLLAAFATISVEWAANKLPSTSISLYSHFCVLVGDAVHPNVMAGNLAILLPLALASLLFVERQFHRLEWILIGLAILGMTAILILTLSRGAYLAFGVVLLILIALRWRWGWLVSVTAVASMGIALHFLGSRHLAALLLNASTADSINSRIEIWSQALYMIQDFSLTGVGMGSFTPVANILYPFHLGASGTLSHAHNLFAQIAVDLGLPGLVAWLAIFLSMLAVAWRLYCLGRAAGDRWLVGLGAGLLCSQVALAIHGLFDAVTWGMMRPAPLVWALWGLAAAGWNLYSSQEWV